MAANMYDQAAQAQFINTYVPINFGELYRIGAAQKAAVDEAAQQFGTQLQKFGEFQSPSQVDTQRYYDLTIGREDFQNAINQMVANPDYLKDAANRSSLQSMINSIDYSTLSQLKQSSDNLNARQKMIAQMKAQGKYNPNWDDININLWDTSNKGIMTELSPLEWMNANQLSNVYFDNLKPSTLQSVYKDGVKYQRQGITYDTLKGIAEARFNDLIATPQGQMYYRDALRASGGDEAAAKEAFTTMIADSQRDRIVEQETIDPYWLAMAKQRMSAGSNQPYSVMPTRQQMLETDWSSKVVPKFSNIPESSRKEIENLASIAKAEYDKYQKSGSDEDYINYLKAANRAQQYQSDAYQKNMQKLMKEDFQKAANFKLSDDPNKSKEYSRKGYLRGISYALDEASSTASLIKEDPILTSLGATYQDYTQANGQKVGVYQFNNSNGFMLPETVFQFATNTGQSKVKRDAGLFRSGDFPFKELVENGRLGDVQFVPENRQNLIQLGNNKLIKGKLRIPVEEIENTLGTGILYSLKGDAPSDYLFPTTLFARQSTKRALEDNFGSREVKYGEDGKPFYEVEVYRQLPDDNNGDYWYQVNQLRENSPSQRGVGGATQAQAMQEQSVRSIYNQ